VYFQEWDDERLTWNPREFHNVIAINVKAENMWVPDIMLINRCACTVFLP